MRNKSESNFEQILEDNKHKIYRICKIYSVAPLEPQDLFQEVVFQIWKSLDDFNYKSSIDTWIYKIAINVCLRSKIKFDKSNNKTERFESIHFTPMYAGDTVPPVMMIPCHYFHDIFKGNLVNFQPFSLMFFLSDSPSSSMR